MVIVQSDLFKGVDFDPLIRAMPKIDLHRHLSGSIRISTILDVVRHYDIDIAIKATERSIRRTVQFSVPTKSVDAFIDRAWGSVLGKILTTPEVLTRVILEAIEDAANDNVIYVEFRISPMRLSGFGYSLRVFIEALVQGVNMASDQFPDTQVKLILSLRRHSVGGWTPNEREVFYEELLSEAKPYSGTHIVGVDLVGMSAEHYPLSLFLPFFTAASNHGLETTIHVGEADGASAMWEVLETIRPKRIGHGIAAANDPALLHALARGQVHLEICPTSNYLTGVTPRGKSHPLGEMFRAGIPVSINTDDPTVCNVTQSSELISAINNLGLSLEEVIRINRRAALASFSSDPEKQKLLKKLDTWSAALDRR